MVGLRKDDLSDTCALFDLDVVVDLQQALDHTAPRLTHSHFNPDTPYLASLVADEEAVGVDPEAAGELDGDPFDPALG